MGRGLARFKISGVLSTICIALAPFKYVFRTLWIWARRFLLLGGPLSIGGSDSECVNAYTCVYVLVSEQTSAHICIRIHVYIYIYIYIHMYTHIHMYRLFGLLVSHVLKLDHT